MNTMLGFQITPLQTFIINILHKQWDQKLKNYMFWTMVYKSYQDNPVKNDIERNDNR